MTGRLLTLKNTKLVLSIDPSGNWFDGKGRSGLVLAEVDEEGFTVIHKETINAKDFDTYQEYWVAHINAVDPELDALIVEDFMLYPGVSQHYSYMETPRLIGVLQMQAYALDIPITLQRATEVSMLKESVLIERGILEKRKGRYWHDKRIYNDHERSALKHLLKWYRKEYHNEPIQKENQSEAVRVPTYT